jgi:hypothetical protein
MRDMSRLKLETIQTIAFDAVEAGPYVAWGEGGSAEEA